jgi:predicted MFS family arabinose efflux permease
MGTMFLLPQYLQYVQNHSVITAGLLMVPLGIGAGVGARYNARVFASLGPRLTLGGGMLALAGSVALLLSLSRDTSVAVVLVATGLLGGLISIVVAPATAVIMNDLGEEKAGDGGAVNQLARQVGGALGVALIGTVFAGIYAARVDELSSLDAAQRSRAGESIEEARDVVDSAAVTVQHSLSASVDHAFDVAARAGFGVCVGVLVVAALIAAVLLAPRRLVTKIQVD